MSVTSTLIAFSCLMLPDVERTISTNELPLAREVATEELPHEWLTSYEQGKQLAARQGLPLLLHFDASWCGACRRMESQVLHKTDVTQLLGRNVVGVRVDADRYKDLIREYGISTLPTEVVVQPDGSRGPKLVGAVSLSAYVSRLQNLRSPNAGQAKPETQTGLASTVASKNETKDAAAAVRSCLIVRHDGKMVGMGGYSPVALVAEKKWKKGSDAFVATHEGVEYFLLSQDEVSQFTANPLRYIPGMHGCDLVELHLENRATAGAIEYGAFYQGKVFFFASLENRDRFENNPTWYLGAMTDARTANDEMFPFLERNTANN